MTSDNRTLWEIFEAQGYTYDPIYDGWKGRIQGQFYSTDAVNRYPGDIKHALLTGEVRNLKIFDLSDHPSLKQLGLRRKKTGQLVKIGVVKK